MDFMASSQKSFRKNFNLNIKIYATKFNKTNLLNNHSQFYSTLVISRNRSYVLNPLFDTYRKYNLFTNFYN